MNSTEEIWELLVTRNQARAIVAVIDQLLEGENADAFSDDERDGLSAIAQQMGSDLDDEP